MMDEANSTPGVPGNTGEGKGGPAQLRRRGIWSDEIWQKMQTRLVEAMDATKIERGTGYATQPDQQYKGRREYVEVADHPIRFAALKFAFEMELGKAPQSLEITDPGAAGGLRLPSSADTIRLMEENPKLAQKIFGSLFDVMKKAQKTDGLEVYDANTGKPPESQSGASKR